MKDKNGNSFGVGSKLQSTQSPNDAGIVECVSVDENDNTCELQDSFWDAKPFRINQSSLDNSLWVVRI